LRFFSYASEDSKRVEAFYDAFKAEGLDPWMDCRDIPVGADWELALRDAIARCDQFVFFASRHSASKRGFLQRELKQAARHWEERLEDDIYCIPVRLEAVDPPRFLMRFQYIDAFDDSHIPLVIERLRIKGNEGPAPVSLLRQTLVYRMIPIEVPESDSSSEIEAAVPQFSTGDGKPLSKANKLIENIARGYVTGFLGDARESQTWLQQEEMPTTRDGVWIDPTVTTATRSLISLELYVSTYLYRAAHRAHETRTVLIDVASETELSLKEILKDEKVALDFFSRYCAIALRTQWELTYLAFGTQLDASHPQPYLDTFNDPNLENFQHFVFRDTNLVFIFDPYHVGPYAFGRRTVELPFNDMYKLLTDRMVELLIGRALSY
jgi:hypothetical protein